MAAASPAGVSVAGAQHHGIATVTVTGSVRLSTESGSCLGPKPVNAGVGRSFSNRDCSGTASQVTPQGRHH